MSMLTPLRFKNNSTALAGIEARQSRLLLTMNSQTWDAFDFFTVSLTASDLAETFDKSVADITWGITLVLMFRSVGSILFGIAADRYGRKWPFIVNNVLFMVLELVSRDCFYMPFAKMV